MLYTEADTVCACYFKGKKCLSIYLLIVYLFYPGQIWVIKHGMQSSSDITLSGVEHHILHHLCKHTLASLFGFWATNILNCSLVFIHYTWMWVHVNYQAAIHSLTGKHISTSENEFKLNEICFNLMLTLTKIMFGVTINYKIRGFCLLDLCCGINARCSNKPTSDINLTNVGGRVCFICFISCDFR